jgi:hypothetical protein
MKVSVRHDSIAETVAALALAANSISQATADTAARVWS